MAILILVRHGRSEANAAGTLAGRLPDVHLDRTGRTQVAELGARLREVPLRRLVASPVERCQETAQAILAARPGGTLEITEDSGITECDYGSWQGRTIADLRRESLWDVVQRTPSQAVFPGGESLAAMQARAIDAVRRHEREISEQHGPHAVWAAVTHGDVIKSVLADALAADLDDFQRIHVDPASVSIVSYGRERPLVWCMNSLGGGLDWLSASAEVTTDEAVPGGGAGPERCSTGSGAGA